MKLQIFEVISVVVLKCHVVRILFPGKPNVNIRSVYFDHDDGRILPRKKILVYSTTGLVLGPFAFCATAFASFLDNFLRLTQPTGGVLNGIGPFSMKCPEAPPLKIWS